MHVLVVFLTVLYSWSSKQSCDATETAQEFVMKMGSGINIGNTLDAIRGEGTWAPPAQKYFFTDIKAHGFSHVRLPVSWTWYMDDSGDPTNGRQWIDPEDITVTKSYLDRVEEVVNWALNSGLIVVINSHHDAWICANYNAKNKARFDTLWRKIMERFRNYSHNLVFEILNEPYITKYTREAASEDKPFPFSDISQTNQNGCTREQIADLNLRTLSAIRSSGGMNQERIVVIAGSMKPVVWEQQGAEMGRYIDVSHPIYATDQRIVATFHYYREDPSNIGHDFNEAKKWSESTGIPWYIGEFLHDETNDGIKSTFYETIRMEAFRHQFSIAIWDIGRAYTREEGPYSPNKFDNVMMAPLPTEATPTKQPTPASCVPNWGACDENSVCCGDGNPDRNWQCYVSSFMQTNQRTQCRHKCGKWNEGDCNLLVDMRTPYPTEDYTSYPTKVPSLKPTTPIPNPTAAPFLAPTLAPVSADPTEAPSETEENFCTLPLWRKCGGKTWVGCTHCKDSVCVYGGEYFSQCKPIA